MYLTSFTTGSASDVPHHNNIATDKVRLFADVTHKLLAIYFTVSTRK